MNIRKAVTAAALAGPVIFAAPSGAHSEVNYRWATAAGRGGIVHDSIRSADGTELTFYCGAADMGQRGLMFHPKGEDKLAPVSLKGRLLFQFVIDGKNYPFEVDDGMIAFPDINNDTPMSVARPYYAFNEMVQALIKSKSRSFVVEVPDKQRSWKFSLLNIQDTSLGTGKTFCSNKVR
jgi:hypothetical protein